MEPSSNNNMRYFYQGNPNRPWGKEIIIGEKIEAELKRLLQLKYPGRIIDVTEIINYGTTRIPSISKMYVSEFDYQNNRYIIETLRGEDFKCNRIKIKKTYSKDILNIAIDKISQIAKKQISIKDITIGLYEEKQVGGEMNYFFCIAYEENPYMKLCFNEQGETKTWTSV